MRPSGTPARRRGRHTLRGAGPPRCVLETGNPEECEPILWECETPPEELCMREFEHCVDETGHPEECEPILIECFEPEPEPEPHPV